jgi:hypothetical protein
MTTDPVEPQEPRKPRGVDPFERAARREEQEELRREITRARVLNKVVGKDSDTGAALVVFGVPYAIWALIRAAFYDFGSPTLPRSIVHFFFGDWWWFGAYTAWVLFLVWVALIKRFSGDDD